MVSSSMGSTHLLLVEIAIPKAFLVTDKKTFCWERVVLTVFEQSKSWKQLRTVFSKLILSCRSSRVVCFQWWLMFAFCWQGVARHQIRDALSIVALQSLSYMCQSLQVCMYAEDSICEACLFMLGYNPHMLLFSVIEGHCRSHYLTVESKGSTAQ